MAVTRCAGRDRRIALLSWIGPLLLGAFLLVAAPAFAPAAETGSKPVPPPARGETADKPSTASPKAESATKKTATTKTKSKTAAKKKKSTTVARKHPLPPPPKPAALAAAATAAPAAADETAKADLAAGLDKRTAELVPTASRPAEPEGEPPPAAAPDDAKRAATKAAPKPAEGAPVATEAMPPRAEPKVATAPPEPAVTLTKEAVRIQFGPGASDLPETAEPSIQELAGLMAREPSLRLQLLAFATGTKETASQARRLSLNRALAVRGALIDAGVRSTRIDVRALGNKTEESPADRVDILVMQRGGG